MDANAKIGNEIINGDPHEMSPNGKLLMDLISRKQLVVVNCTDKCTGVITRTKVKGKSTEQSVLDYFIVCQDLYSLVQGMWIDEQRDYVLTRFYKQNGQTKTVESDHNVLVLDICYSWNVNVKEERIEIFNLRNKKCQEHFYNNTNRTDVLSKCLLD